MTDAVLERANEGTDEIRTSLGGYTLALGNNIEKLSYTGTSGFVGIGNELANVITGGVGDDTLDGGSGKDTMIGGLGNDTYVVDNVGDVVTEAAAAGVDAILTNLATYSIASLANIENLTGTSASGQILTGNAAANVITGAGGADTITGGSGNDTLDGGAGADILSGGLGNDIYVVDNLGDVVTEAVGAGTDTIKTTLASYSLATQVNVENLTGIAANGQALTGSLTANVVTGGAGDDTLDGAGGIDTLVGGQGNDTYVVGVAGEVVTEAANAGTDTVQTSLTSYTLGTNIENLTGTAGSGQALTGNTLANVLIGNAGDDALNGGTGADTMIGGLGNDTYIVDNVGDTVVEAAGAGTDLIQTALASYSIASLTNIENLTHTGAAAFAGTGNDLDNILTGSTGNDTLDGGVGSDTMIGGLGNDRYIVDAIGDVVVEAAAAGTDTIKTTLATYSIESLTDIENLTGTLSTGQILTGNAGGNVITGGAGNDTIDGVAGADTLVGGQGNDIYIVGNAAEVVTEAANAGIDTVQTNLAGYTLGANVENLTGTSVAGQALTGNTLANLIVGNMGDDALNGGTGIDTMIGGLGNDLYTVDNAGDLVAEFANEGTDTIQTTLASYSLATKPAIENLTYIGAAAFTGIGNDLVNIISGGNGNNTLDGGAGADIMIGGLGNDTYLIDNAGDVVTEATNAGTDTIKTVLVNYSIDSQTNIENLTGTAGIAQYLTGNILVNVITGGVGNDTLDGGTGNDTMVGGQGNDTYFVDATGDIVTEAANAGTDTIVTTLASYSISALTNVENLTGNAATGQSLTGNTLANLIMGGVGDDTLGGGAGNDRLTGGGGADAFVFNTALNATTNVDTITDFTHLVDKIYLENAFFTSLGLTNNVDPSVADFLSSSTGTATNTSQHIIYNSTTGALIYDSNGSAAGGATQFAALAAGLTLTNSDFFVT